MVESVPRNVELLLEGKPYEELHEFCDTKRFQTGRDSSDVTLASPGCARMVPGDRGRAADLACHTK